MTAGSVRALPRSTYLWSGVGLTVTGVVLLALNRWTDLDLILADPPYADGSGSTVVASVVTANWLAPGGWMAIETERGATVDPGPLTVEAERDTGRARLTLLRFA